jgi:hypothetical protein
MNKNIPTFKAKKISETQVQFTCSKCKRKLHHSIEEGHRWDTVIAGRWVLY